MKCGLLRSLILLGFPLSSLLLPIPPAQAINELVVTEFLADPKGFDSDGGEYFEVFNTGDRINSTLTIKDKDNDSVDLSDVTIPSNSFFVFGDPNSSNSDNSYIDQEYDRSNFIIANGDDEIVIEFSNSNETLGEVTYQKGDEFDDSDIGVAKVLENLNKANEGITT